MGKSCRRAPRAAGQSQGLHCEVCRVSWAPHKGTLATHNAGRKHKQNVLSCAYYGAPGYDVAPLRFDDVQLPHRAVSAAVLARVRDVWTTLSGDMATVVALTGVDECKAVLELLRPERLACAAVRLHATAEEPAAGRWTHRTHSAAAFAYACALLEHEVPRPSTPAVRAAEPVTPLGEVALVLEPPVFGGSRTRAEWLALGHSSCMLGRALVHGLPARRVVLTVHVREPQGAETRALARLVSVLSVALGHGAGLRHVRELELRLRSGLEHRQYAAPLARAEAASWRARARMLLLGTHPRAGAASPLRALPAHVLELVYAHAQRQGRTAVSVRAEAEPARRLGTADDVETARPTLILPPGAPPHAVAARAQPAEAVVGADLLWVAQQLSHS